MSSSSSSKKTIEKVEDDAARMEEQSSKGIHRKTRNRKSSVTEHSDNGSLPVVEKGEPEAEEQIKRRKDRAENEAEVLVSHDASETQRKRHKRKIASDDEEEVPSTSTTHNESESSTLSKGVFTAYLAGFPYDTDIDAFVREQVSGVIAVRVHTWHDTGRSRGCAHVDFITPKDLKAGLEKLDRMTIGSRYISAVEAKDKTSDNLAPPPKEDDSRGGRRLFVKNLPYDITETRMKDFFSKFGAVKHVRIPQWNHTDNKKGFAYVEFEQKAFAVKCVQTHRDGTLELSGRKLTLDYDQGKPKRGFKDEQGRAWYKPKTSDRSKRQ